MSDAQAEADAFFLQMRDDFPAYARTALQIRTKTGAIDPLVLNRAQQFIHQRLEEQRRKTGRVRALVLKGRQQGCSTYVAGRFYWRATHRFGARVFILTHEDAATVNLFEMVQRYHEHVLPDLRPMTGAANAKELYFAGLDSGYKVGTAGTKGVGRSSTIQMFHGSEVAFWPNASTHAAGVLQAVPDVIDTEVILESTANGVGNFFHQRWRDAESGTSDYQAIFVPWYWQEEYRRPPEPDFHMTDEERDYAAAYGLDDEQIAWRRFRTRELNNDATLFMQEYPATAAEAFQMTGHDSYIPAPLVVRARKARVTEAGPLILGVDPAWMGKDRSAIAWRRGRRLIKVEARASMDTMSLAGWVNRILQDEKPRKVFIDVGGVGAGVFDRLVEMGHDDVVTAINFGGAPFDPPPPEGGGPLNRRAEMWMKSREWLAQPAGVQIPDLDDLQADACGPSFSYDSSSRVRLEKKEDMRRRGVASPDLWDAVALTFAEPVGDGGSFGGKITYPDLGIV
jgi:hypothetical protein